MFGTVLSAGSPNTKVLSISRCCMLAQIILSYRKMDGFLGVVRLLKLPYFLWKRLVINLY